MELYSKNWQIQMPVITGYLSLVGGNAEKGTIKFIWMI